MEAQMGKKLYVGNLTYGVTNETLEQMFAPHGKVQSAQVIMDRDRPLEGIWLCGNGQ
jgi:RNA recognition motif-containing protein